MKESDQYKYYVEGIGTTGWKRDPFARSLTRDPPYPNCNCSVTQPRSFPWYDAGYRTPDFSDLIIYQLHVGVFWSVDSQGVDRRKDRPGRFRDVLFKLDYLVDLGINAVQFLPIQEFRAPRSLGYMGTDCFSPEMDYSVAPTDPEFPDYLAQANAHTRGLIGVRRRFRALRSDSINVFHVQKRTTTGCLPFTVGLKAQERTLS